jgi:hypothetical protein
MFTAARDSGAIECMSMWPQRFLTVGVASAACAAALALALMWLVLAALTRLVGFPFTFLLAFGAPGIVLYPLCWYAAIFRRRSYGRSDTWRLIACTYAASCALAAVILCADFAYQAATAARPPLPGEVPWGPMGYAAIPILAIKLVFIAAIVLAVPFVAIAGPVAFLHRAILLARFGGGAEPGATRAA